MEVFCVTSMYGHMLEALHLLVLETKFVLHPGIHIGTFKAGVQVSFALQLAGVQFTALRVVTGDQIWIDVLFALPWLKVGDLRESGWCSHPFDRLVVGHDEHVLGEENGKQASVRMDMSTCHCTCCLPCSAAVRPRTE